MNARWRDKESWDQRLKPSPPPLSAKNIHGSKQAERSLESAPDSCIWHVPPTLGRGKPLHCEPDAESSLWNVFLSSHGKLLPVLLELTRSSLLGKSMPSCWPWEMAVADSTLAARRQYQEVLAGFSRRPNCSSHWLFPVLPSGYTLTTYTLERFLYGLQAMLSHPHQPERFYQQKNLCLPSQQTCKQNHSLHPSTSYQISQPPSCVIF